ncbi:DinB family protein [Seonamhaeicola sediminis]|uniref:DinB family protein n=1 Tax=Seonamhaeicola sediminis TaxID=2528206 RepID=A0A562YH33_9FLAO|nr:DinB family protein [Seonamhaeicola sediminis]TWO33868.1 DinB family protein [Seonamhaeicola sediminis]
MPFPLEILQKTRKSFKNFLEDTSLDNLNKIPEGHKNNIIWNIGHILVTEQLLAYKLSGLPTMVSDSLIEKYRKGSIPEGYVTQNEVDEIKGLLEVTIEKTAEDYKKGRFKNFNEYTVSTTGNTLTNIDESLQFILFHEGMHLGIVMSLLKAV